MEGNTIKDNASAGIALHDLSCPDIIENSITNNKAGIVVAGKARPQITGNTLSGNELVGVHLLDSADPIVENNLLLHGHGTGVLLCKKSQKSASPHNLRCKVT